MSKSPYQIGHELFDHPEVDEVEVRHDRITVAHVPGDRHTEKIPFDMFNHIMEVIDGTVFVWEGVEPTPYNVEQHSVVGGVHSRAIAGGNPELQVSLVI